MLPQGGGQDKPYLPDAAANLKRQFGRPPNLLAADRFTASTNNRRLAEEASVKPVSLSHVGEASPDRRVEERGRHFRQD